jgi:ArsR family transcriptional regulator, arsenate/arsenite/antimonite-responsive transcriptional repressor / arsenate reductase (thioredoxin)
LTIPLVIALVALVVLSAVLFRGRSRNEPGEAAADIQYVIRLCDRVREVCPEFPGGPELIHWSIPDPAREPGSDEETLPAFERTATELHARIGFLIEAIEQTTTNKIRR